MRQATTASTEHREADENGRRAGADMASNVIKCGISNPHLIYVTFFFKLFLSDYIPTFRSNCIGGKKKQL